jgi:DNA polymerase III epsilon subunit-like protein
MIFSVVDVETTGGKPEYAAITEIAIVKKKQTDRKLLTLTNLSSIRKPAFLVT